MWGIEVRNIAPRPVVLDGKRVHSYGGQTLVVRKRSSSGRKVDQREALRSVRLKAIDDACVIDGRSRSSQFGQVFKSQHMCEFYELPVELPPGDYQLWASGDGSLMYREDYGDTLTPGEIVVLGNGEYVQAESRSGRLLVSWSSTTTPVEFFVNASQVLRSDFSMIEEGFLQLSVSGEFGDHAEGSPDEILEYLQAGHDHVAYVRLDLQDGTRLAWRALAARLRSSTQGYVEVSLDRASSAGGLEVQQVILASATNQVRERRRSVFSELKQLVA